MICDHLTISSIKTYERSRVVESEEELKVSTPSLYPSSRAGNTLYLAFGVSMTLFLLRITNPVVFDDPLALLTQATLFSPLVSSVLYYVKIDKLMLRLLKGVIKYNHNSTMLKFQISTDFAIEIWRLGEQRQYSPENKIDSILTRLVDGPDISDDIWNLKGVFYFVLSVPILLFAFSSNIWEMLLYSAGLIIVVLLAVGYHLWELPSLGSKVAMFRDLQQKISVFKANDPGNRPNPNKFLGPKGDDYPIQPVIEELHDMIIRHDWKGFSYRFDILHKDIITWSFQLNTNLFEIYLTQLSDAQYEISTPEHIDLARAFSLWNLIQKGKSVDMIIDLHNLYPSPNEGDKGYFLTVDRTKSEVLREKSKRVFKQLMKEKGVMNNSDFQDITRIIHGWAMDGNKTFSNELLHAAEVIQDKKLIIDIALIVPFEYWNEAGPKLIKTVKAEGYLEKPPITQGRKVWLERLLTSHNFETLIEAIILLEHDELLTITSLSLVNHSDSLVRTVVVSRYVELDKEKVKYFLELNFESEDFGTQKKAALMLVRLVKVFDWSTYPFEKKQEFYQTMLTDLCDKSHTDTYAAILDAQYRLGIRIDEEELRSLANLAKKGQYEQLRQTARMVLMNQGISSE